MKKMRVAILTNVLPSYREGFYDRIFAHPELDVRVYCQSHIPGMNLATIHPKYLEHVSLLDFVSLPREQLCWQFLPWLELFRGYDVVFVGGNPRVFSDLLISTVMRIFCRPVVHWTMAHSYRNNTLTETIRLLWSKIFPVILVYTDAEVEYLRKIGFKNNYLLGMNNGLDQKAIDAVSAKWGTQRLNVWRSANILDNKRVILSCARLDKKNNFDIMVEAVPLLIQHIPNLMWVVIGDGAEKERLVKAVRDKGVCAHVKFVGALYAQEELAPWFLSSELLIHPAAIGLSLLHSFGYGLPVVVHGNAKEHGPEYAVFEPGLTGRNYRKGNLQDLVCAVTELLVDVDARKKMREYVLAVARKKMNVDVMVDRFIRIARIAHTRDCSLRDNS